MMTEIRMNKKTNFPDLERLAKTNFWKRNITNGSSR